MTRWPEWSVASARDLIAPHSNKPGGLLPALHALQDHFGCIAQEAVDLAADIFNVSRAEVYGVVSFYDDFRKVSPEGRVLKVCMAEACQAVGAEALKVHAEAIASDQTGGQIEVKEVFCLGNCACGPSVMVEGKVFGRVSEVRLDALVNRLAGGDE